MDTMIYELLCENCSATFRPPFKRCWNCLKTMAEGRALVRIVHELEELSHGEARDAIAQAIITLNLRNVDEAVKRLRG